MNCTELTIFLQKVLDKRELIYDPKDESIFETHKLVEEVEETWEKNQPFNMFLRVELSQELDLSHVGDFYDGWAVAVRDGLNVYVNKDGEFLRGEDGEILEFVYEYADRFSEGIAATIRDGKLVFIRIDGSFISGNFSYSIDIPWHYRFAAGIACARPEDKGFPKYINKDGIFPENLNRRVRWASRFSEDGYAAPDLLDNSQPKAWSFVNQSGENLTVEDGCEYFPAVVNFSEGYAWVKAVLSNGEKEWRVIDTGGKYQRNILGIITRIFQADRVSVRPFKCGWGRVEDNVTKRSQFFSPQREVLVDENGNNLFESAQDFSEGYSIVKIDGQYQLLGMDGRYMRDEDGEIVAFRNIKAFYKGTYIGFEDGLINIVIKKDNPSDERWQYMDHRGRIVEFGNKTSSKS